MLRVVFWFVVSWKNALELLLISSSFGCLHRPSFPGDFRFFYLPRAPKPSKTFFLVPKNPGFWEVKTFVFHG